MWQRIKEEGPRSPDPPAFILSVAFHFISYSAWTVPSIDRTSTLGAGKLYRYDHNSMSKNCMQ